MSNLELNISRVEILRRAEAMVPVLQERAREAELARCVPEQTDQEFRDAGFYRILQPAKFGGLELDFGTQTELGVILSSGCASSGWVAAVTACHGWLLGMFPPKAQEDVWGDNPEASVASSFLGFGPKVERVEGGLQIDGRWGFSSGVNHCSWVALQVAVPPEKEGDRPALHFALVPLDECEIIDTWQTTGLAATGSNDIVLKDVFVPDYRTVAFMALRGGPTPGSEINPGYLYQIPQRATFSFNLVGSVIGAARGMVQMLIDEMKKRVTVGGANLQELSTVQYRIAEAESEVAAAYALMDRNRSEIIANGKAGLMPSMEDRARYRRDNGYATKLCVQAVDRVYPIMGGRGIVAGNAVNRAWRDTHAIAHHIALTWDVVASTAASLAVGGPNDDPLL